MAELSQPEDSQQRGVHTGPVPGPAPERPAPEAFRGLSVTRVTEAEAQEP